MKQMLDTFKETNMSHLENRRIIFKSPLKGKGYVTLQGGFPLQLPSPPPEKEKKHDMIFQHVDQLHTSTSVQFVHGPVGLTFLDEISFYFGNLPAWYTQYLKAFCCTLNQVSHEKNKNLLLSIESWLVHRDPYNGLWNNPCILG